MTKRTFLICAAAVLAASTLAACSPLSVVNAVSPGGASKAETAVRYGSDARNMLDIYRPKSGAASAPVIVFFYGGNWVSGKRSDYAFVGRARAARGVVGGVAG
jgi:acetyl esterase/lipase